MSNGHTQEPCNCTSLLIDRLKREKKACPGLLTVELQNGSQIAGLMMFSPSLALSHKVKQTVLAFHYCPWCGQELTPVRTDAPEKGKEKLN